MISRMPLLAVLAALFLSLGTSVSLAALDRTRTSAPETAPTSTEPTPVATIALPSKLTAETTNKIILRAAIGRKWTVLKTTPNSVVIHLVHRGYDATLTFKHDAKRITIDSDSWLVSKSGVKKKRKDPEGWIENLEKDIKHLIMREMYL